MKSLWLEGGNFDVDPLKSSFKVGLFSDPQHTHLGILHWNHPRGSKPSSSQVSFTIVSVYLHGPFIDSVLLDATKAKSK